MKEGCAGIQRLDSEVLTTASVIRSRDALAYDGLARRHWSHYFQRNSTELRKGQCSVLSIGQEVTAHTRNDSLRTSECFATKVRHEVEDEDIWVEIPVYPRGTTESSFSLKKIHKCH